MKLIGNLKKKVENAETKEEAREAIKKAGMLLSDEELENVSGGIGIIKKDSRSGGYIFSDETGTVQISRPDWNWLNVHLGINTQLDLIKTYTVKQIKAFLDQHHSSGNMN